MDATPALVITRHQLKKMLEETANQAASAAVDQLKSELNTDPDDRLVQRLRDYIIDPTSLDNPRDYWASGPHVRAIENGNNGKPKSIAWFHRFKVKSGLKECFHRRSKRHGHLQEWNFEDIRLCWESYYAFR